MLSQEKLEEYRRMTPGQRLGLALQMTEESLAYLVQGPPEVVERRFELLRRENDLRNYNMRVAMARTRPAS
jgi:RecB family endonuclease NucS